MPAQTHHHDTPIANTSRGLRWAWAWTLSMLLASSVLTFLFRDGPLWAIAPIVFGLVSTLVCFGAVLRWQLAVNDYRRVIERRASDRRAISAAPLSGR